MNSTLNSLAGLIEAMHLKDRIKEAMDGAGMSPADLARATKRTPGAVTQWLDGMTKSLKAETASRIELATGYCATWIATGKGQKKLAEQRQYPAQVEKSNVSEIERRAKVPLISLIQAGELTDVCDLLISVESCQWVEPIYTHPSRQAYALRVEGDSMESPIPGAQTFLEGTTLIVDPDVSCGPNDYVIAKDIATGKATFKKLTTDGVRWYLKPLNPIYPTVEIDDPALRVIGKVIEFQPPGGKL